MLFHYISYTLIITSGVRMMSIILAQDVTVHKWWPRWAQQVVPQANRKCTIKFSSRTWKFPTASLKHMNKFSKWEILSLYFTDLCHKSKHLLPYIKLITFFVTIRTNLQMTALLFIIFLHLLPVENPSKHKSNMVKWNCAMDDRHDYGKI